MATYNEKIKDSFKTYIRISSFNKLLKELQEDINYDIDEQFFENLDQNISKKDISNYANKYYQGINYNDKLTYKLLENKFYLIYDFTSSTGKDSLIKKYKNQYQKYQDIFNDEFKKYKKRFHQNFSETDFNAMNKNTKCAYCNIEIHQLGILRKGGKIGSKSGRGFSLEIDRISPNLEYTKDNCCMSCYWCNNAKTDEFSASEFKTIAKGINETWNKRLQEIESSEIVPFQEDAEIWRKDEN